MNQQERISVSRKPGSTSIIISPNRNAKKEGLMAIWILAWAVGGVFIWFYFLTGSLDRDQRLFLLIWLAFWAYFLWLAGYGLLWRKKGFERILVKEGKLYYRKEMMGRGKAHVIETETIRSIEAEPLNVKSLAGSLANSFWHVGGETIAINYYTKRLKIGQQLNPAEQKKLLHLLKEAFLPAREN